MPIPAFYQYSQSSTANLHCLAFEEKREEQSGVSMGTTGEWEWYLSSEISNKAFSPSINPLSISKSKHWIYL